MRKAKNIKCLIIGVLSLVFCVTALTSVGQSKTFASDYQSQPDGGLKTEVFYDRFDGDLKTEWTVKDSQIEIENYALHFTKNYSWGNCLVLNAVKLTDYTKIAVLITCRLHIKGYFCIVCKHMSSYKIPILFLTSFSVFEASSLAFSAPFLFLTYADP